MTGRIAAALSSIALAVVLAGCGGTRTVTVTVTTTVTQTVAPQTTVRVYFLRDGKVAPVARQVSGPDLAVAALAALAKGPSAQERAIGLTTAAATSPAGRAQRAYTAS